MDFEISGRPASAGSFILSNDLPSATFEALGRRFFFTIDPTVEKQAIRDLENGVRPSAFIRTVVAGGASSGVVDMTSDGVLTLKNVAEETIPGFVLVHYTLAWKPPIQDQGASNV